MYNNSEWVSITEYYESSKKKSTVRFNGACNSWHENGVLMSEYVQKDGKVVGFITSYFDNGKIFAKARYYDARYHDQYLEYYNNGQLKLTLNYVNGVTVGETKEYFSNGNIQGEGNYNDKGVLSDFVEYAMNGNLFQNRKLLRDDVYYYTKYDTISKRLVYESEQNNNEIYKEVVYNEDGSKTAKIANSDGKFKTDIYDTNGLLTESHDYNEVVSKYKYYDDGQLHLHTSLGKGIVNTTNTSRLYIVNITSTSKLYNTKGILVESRVIKTENNRTGFISKWYAKYNDSGVMIETGMETEQEKKYTKYSDNKVKIEELLSNGDFYTYYDDGKPKSKKIHVGERVVEQRSSLLETYAGRKIYAIAMIEYYPNGTVKSKGYIDADTKNKADKWYYYDESGELISVELGGEKKKPRSSDKRNQALFLADLD